MKKILTFVIMFITLMSSVVFATTSDNDKETQEKLYQECQECQEYQETMKKLYHDIIITFLTPIIDRAVEDYYKGILISPPSYQVFNVKIISILKT